MATLPTLNGDFVPGVASQADVDLKATKRIYATANFTAVAYGRYQTAGTVTVTDPGTAVAGDIYEVIVASGTATIGGVSYAVSRVPIIRVYVGGAWTTLSSVFTDAVTLNAAHNTAPGQSGVTPAANDLLICSQADTRYAGPVYFARLTSDASAITNNTTQTNISGLAVTIPEGTYEAEMGLYAVAANSSPGIKLGYALSANCDVRFTRLVGADNGNATLSGAYAQNNNSGYGQTTNGTTFNYYNKGLLVASGSTTVNAQASQYTATADNVTVKTFSYLLLRKLI